MGTSSADRQPGLERLLLEPARGLPGCRFVVGGAQYPSTLSWPQNVERLEHVPPAEHAAFYGASRVTLNLTRRDMLRVGHSPSVRLFEAAACGVVIASDRWSGMESIFEPGEELLLVDSADEVMDVVSRWPQEKLARIAAAGRRRFLAHHTSAHRAATFERYVLALAGASRPTSRRPSVEAPTNSK